MQSLCFVGPMLIELVNRVNNKLLYSELLQHQSNAAATKVQEEYALLNAFELLWNLDRQALNMADPDSPQDVDC
jgi:hypothetical protein